MPSGHPRLRRAGLPRILALIGLTTAISSGAHAQQRMNFGPSPYGGAPFPEFLVPPGSLGGLFALARPDGIMYDVRKLQPYGGVGSPLFRFMRAHEYAHVERQHRASSPTQYFRNELEADCDAAELLGWNSSEIQAAARAYRREVPSHDTPGMPGSDRRVRNLRECGGG